MYTRCPSCRAEISFPAPANADQLPDGYKHRIQCPSCGVTIGVKIPKVQTEAMVYQPQNSFATLAEPTLTAAAVDTPETAVATTAPAKAKSAKKPGTMRNVFMLIFSLVFIAISALAYCIDTMQFLPDQTWVYSITALGSTPFDGILGFSLLINEFETFVAMFQGESILSAIMLIIPMALFVFACINALVSLLALIGKKYARAWFFISSFLTALFAWAIVLLPAILTGLFAGAESGAMGETILAALKLQFTEYLLTIDGCFVFALALWASLQFIFSLFFTKSLKRKNK